VWFIAKKTNRATGALNPQLHKAASDQLQVVKQLYTYTNKYVGPVRAGVAAIGAGFPPGVMQGAHSVEAELAAIPSARLAALSSRTSAIAVIQNYNGIIDVLLAFEDQIALTGNNPQLTSTVAALSQISRLENEYSIQRALIVYALTVGRFAPN